MTYDADGSGAFSRRELLVGAGASLMLSAAPLGAADSAGSTQKKESKPYDVLVKGGKVIDPSQNLEDVRDVAIRNGKIARVDTAIPAEQAKKVIQAEGKIVTPGLIDLHTHVFPYVGPFGIEPDPYCVSRGATTVIDAGTTGAFSVEALRRFIVDGAATRIRALLHVVSIGLIAGNTPNMGELEDLRYCDPQMAVKVAKENRDFVVGFKIRFSDFLTGKNDVAGMNRAREAADEDRLPLMIHIGGSTSPLKDFLAMMKKGDVVTHAFNGRPHGVLNGSCRILPEVLQARERGVLFDVGHGMGSFSFDVMEKCLQQGFKPDTISTDLHALNINGPVFDFPTTLSKFLLLGLSMREVIERATVNAARVFNFGVEIGTLKPGAEGDVTVLDLKDGEFTFIDAMGKTRLGRQKLVPVVTLRGGNVFYPA